MPVLRLIIIVLCDDCGCGWRLCVVHVQVLLHKLVDSMNVLAGFEERVLSFSNCLAFYLCVNFIDRFLVFLNELIVVEVIFGKLHKVCALLCLFDDGCVRYSDASFHLQLVEHSAQLVYLLVERIQLDNVHLELLLAVVAVEAQPIKLTCNLANLLQSELLQFDSLSHSHLQVELFVVCSCRLLFRLCLQLRHADVACLIRIRLSCFYFHINQLVVGLIGALYSNYIRLLPGLFCSAVGNNSIFGKVLLLARDVFLDAALLLVILGALRQVILANSIVNVVLHLVF